MKPIPSPRSLPVVGTMLSILASGGAPKLHLYVDKRHKELGHIYREKIGPVSGVFISDGNYMRKIFALEGKYPRHIVPEAWLLYNATYNCRRGLLFMDGEEWFHFRKAMNNLMLKVKQEEFYTAALVAAENLIETWGREPVVTNLEKQLYKWSLEVIAAVLLGSENYNNYKTEVKPLIDQLSETVHQVFVESASLSLLPVKMVAKLNLPVWKRFVKAAGSTVEQGKVIVETLLAKLDEIDAKNKCGLLSEMMSAQLNVEDLKRIVIDLILAAGDTTAHTTQWLLHLLSMNLTTQNKIYREIQTSEGLEVLNNPLLKGTLKETLRLFPVAPFITRFMPEDVVLDEYQIKANELVLMSLYSSGRNPEYFPQPDAFLPDRWLRGDTGYQGVSNPNASLPFAFGLRSCVGKKIAETQILVTLSKILQHFEVQPRKQHLVDIALHLITVPAEPIELILQRRK
ncbi:hypothetical protein RUM44_008411 [Polyplax serrata]|uniref:Cytochrome P450 n=1 Tax=Polyplax serrata TaxID=468196 RepID=A0ABR1BC81_POLSC